MEAFHINPPRETDEKAAELGLAIKALHHAIENESSALIEAHTRLVEKAIDDDLVSEETCWWVCEYLETIRTRLKQGPLNDSAYQGIFGAIVAIENSVEMDEVV
jgi:hypothetical protein